MLLYMVYVYVCFASALRVKSGGAIQLTIKLHLLLNDFRDLSKNENKKILLTEMPMDRMVFFLEI